MEILTVDRPTRSCECGAVFTPKATTLGARVLFEQKRCNNCAERLWEEQEKADLTEQRKTIDARRETLWNSICPSEYRQTELSRLPQKALADALEWPLSTRGLMIGGKTGSGKTRLLFVVLRRLFDSGVKMRVFTPSAFRASASTAAMDNSAEEWMASIATIPVLALDDLGQMRLTESSEEMLFEVVERRTSNRQPILATTQYSGEAFIRQFNRPERGAAITRRLREFCDQIQT